jgi:hypothetical protein
MHASRVVVSSLVAIFVASSIRIQADDGRAQPAYNWADLDRAIGGNGELKDNVYTYTLPRTDLNVVIEGMDIPAAAGVASVFHFFQCPCGKIRVVGQFCCADYETNDVLDAIRIGAAIQVASVSPMFVGDKPRVMIVRFQGEGDGVLLAKLLKSGLDWIGPARTATQPVR